MFRPDKREKSTGVVRLHSLECHHIDVLSSNIYLLSLNLDRSRGAILGPEDMPNAAPWVGMIVSIVRLRILSDLEARNLTVDGDVDQHLWIESGLNMIGIAGLIQDNTEVLAVLTGEEAPERRIEGIVTHGLCGPVDPPIGKEDLNVELGADVKVAAHAPSYQFRCFPLPSRH